MSHGSFEKVHVAAEDRYEKPEYRRAGNSGLDLPAFSLGLWQNFGVDRPYQSQREIVLHAFDLGITHFDNADRYGPPHRAAQRFFGKVLKRDLAPYRDELILSTKAGNPIGPSPYHRGGSRKSLLASLDQSLRDLGTDYVDIFYSHSPDPTTPLEETVGALVSAVEQGKALYVGLSNYPPRSGHATRPNCCVRPAFRSWSTSPVTRSSTAVPSSTACSSWPTRTASAWSSTRRWRKGSSPASTSTASRRTRVHATARSSPPTSSTTPTGEGPPRSTGSPNSAASRWRSWRCSGCCAGRR